MVKNDEATAPQGSGAQTKRRRFSVDALFTDHRPQASGVEDLSTAKVILLDRIVPDPNQPRHTFDEDKLEELAASIRIEGVLQPIVVRYDEGADTYVVVHGERRWRAARLAGLDRLPAVVRDVPPERRLIQQLMENVVRDDLNAVDRAVALRALKVQLGDVPWDDVANAVGIRRSRLFQLLGTEKLPEAVQDDIRAGRLSEKQSRVFHGLAPEAQEALRTVVVDGDVSAAEATRVAKELRSIDLPETTAEVTALVKELIHGGQHQSNERELSGTDASEPPLAGSGPPRSTPVPPQDGNETMALLGAIVDAARGGERERDVLGRTADVLSVPRYDARRVQRDVATLAGTLARTPGVRLDPADPTGALIRALIAALTALLPADEGRE